MLGVSLGPWSDPGFRSGPRVPLDLQPGQKVEIESWLGGNNNSRQRKTCRQAAPRAGLQLFPQLFSSTRDGDQPSVEIADLGFDATKGWNDSWTKTEEGKRFSGL